MEGHCGRKASICKTLFKHCKYERVLRGGIKGYGGNLTLLMETHGVIGVTRGSQQRDSMRLSETQ